MAFNLYQYNCHHYHIIRLKQCNTQVHGMSFGMTSRFVDKHSNASSNPAAQPCFFSELIKPQDSFATLHQKAKRKNNPELAELPWPVQSVGETSQFAVTAASRSM